MSQSPQLKRYVSLNSRGISTRCISRGLSSPEAKASITKFINKKISKSFSTSKPNNSPLSMKFLRKKSGYSGQYRKAIFNQSRKLPTFMSKKQLQREIMSKDERNLMDSLYVDQKKYRDELIALMNLQAFGPPRSPHRRPIKNPLM